MSWSFSSSFCIAWSQFSAIQLNELFLNPPNFKQKIRYSIATGFLAESAA